ncbi:putative F-box protein At1g47790 [Solanum tuberosum]|uniref:F-box domain-containing protein n=1 Tax=Solanum tuberosum TaxID=4113 RepID=M1DR04_SOLTU|nr:PREDICTED: putative F-box protein At1g47790 [Solanum tuberosum]
MTPKAMKKKSNANTKKMNQICDMEKCIFCICQQKKKKKSNKMDIVAQRSIICPEELIREILSWLPVRSLFRFKCVSKSWDITSDPYFKTKHQSRHANSLRYLFAHTNFCRPQNFHNLYSNSSLSLDEDDVQNIDYLSSEYTCFHILCGSCDGLVLIRLPTRYTHELLLLWNPSTRESIHIPFPIFGLRNSTFGFGYDPTTHDYKILAIHESKSQIQCGILALKSGSWRNVYIETPHIFHTLKNSFGCEDPLAFVHGAFHWIHRNFCVGSFNISNEVYTMIPLSEQMYSYLSLAISGDYHVSILDGMVCLSSACKVDGEYAFTLWGMKDHGVKESWTQLFKIKIAPVSIVKPVYRFADGDVLFQSRDVVRDSFRTSKGRFRLWCDSFVKRGDMINIVTFNESLIDPKTLI